MNLLLLQLGDSALPIGGYSHSWGLEAAIDRGDVREAALLERWVRHWLRHSIGPCEGVVVAAVCRGAAAADGNDLLEATIVPPTLRHASREMGGQLLNLADAWDWAATAVAGLHSVAVSPWHHAPVFATLAAAAGPAPTEALLVYLHQAALGVIGAGVRAIPIGHTHGQQVLSRLHGDIRELAEEFAERDLKSAGSFCPGYEVICDAQSHLYTRLFRS